MINRSSHAPLAIMVALLLAATFLRFVAMFDVPPGMRYDEITLIVEADRIRMGDRPLYLDSSAREALYFYLVAAGEDLFGPHLFAQRWISAAFGLIAVAAIYALGQQMFSVRVGLFAAALSVGAFWALMFSRIGDRMIAVPALLSVAMMFFWRGFNRSRRRDFVIAGSLLGVSTYTYTAVRTLPALLILFLIYLLIFNRAQLRRHGLNIGLACVIGLAIALPMAVHIATVPNADRRVGALAIDGPLNALQRGDAAPLISATVTTAGMFAATGDPQTLYNLPDRPVFDILTGLIFYLSVLICLLKLRHSNCAFLLIWLVVGLLPSILAWPPASNIHSIVAQAPVFLIAAIGLDAIATRLGQIKIARAPLLAGSIIGLILIVHTVHSADDYFNRWANHPDVRAENTAGITALARYFSAQSKAPPLVFSSGNVIQWNPWTSMAFRMNAPLGYSNARWFDARSSFVFPQGATDLVLITPAYDAVPAPLDRRLSADLFPVIEPLAFASAQGVFTATHLSSSLNTRLITMTQASVSLPADVPLSLTATLPVAFGNRLEIIGYDLARSVVQPGKNIRLTTYWRAEDLGLEPLSIFVHVLDAQGNLVAQWDGLTIDQHYIQPGDILAQVHFIGLPPNFPIGTYRLQVGLYSTQTGKRIPVVVAAQPVADRLLLQSIEVKR